MGTIQSSVQGLAWDAQSTFNNLKSNFLGMIEGAVGGVSTAADALINGDTIGLNVDQIPAMRESIRNYVTNLNSHLDQVKADADTSQAFKGDYAQAVTSFVEAIVAACKAYISQLLEFSDKLEIVRQKYVEQDTELASSIGSQATELSSAYTEYKEQS